MRPGHSNSIIRQGVACGRCADAQVASGSGLETGTGYLCPDVAAPNDTTQQSDPHVRDVREICYRWHPWHGQAVQVRANVVKRSGPVAYCSLGRCRELSGFASAALDVGSCKLLQDAIIRTWIRERAVPSRTQTIPSFHTGTTPRKHCGGNTASILATCRRC